MGKINAALSMVSSVLPISNVNDRIKLSQSLNIITLGQSQFSLNKEWVIRLQELNEKSQTYTVLAQTESKYGIWAASNAIDIAKETGQSEFEKETISSTIEICKKNLEFFSSNASSYLKQISEIIELCKTIKNLAKKGK